MTTATEPEVDALTRLANAWPELDDVRWRVRLPTDQYVYIKGDKIDHPDDPCCIAFTMDDGTEQRYGLGEWTSASGIPGNPGPDLSKIVFRLYMFGLANLHDIRNCGAWLQAQPEWIEQERALLDAGSEYLRDAERAHTLRRLGL